MSAPVNANADSTASKQHLFCKSNNINNIQLFSTPNDSKDDQKSHFTPPRLSSSFNTHGIQTSESFVDSKYNLTQNEKEFVLNKPATLLHLIDDGICYGCILKSMKKEPQNKEQLQLKQ